MQGCTRVNCNWCAASATPEEFQVSGPLVPRMRDRPRLSSLAARADAFIAAEGHTSLMATGLVYHDLIEVVPGRWRAGLYWLRLFHGDSGYVAVITDVPGNPSCSATNRIEYIADYVIERFGINRNELTLYQIYPKTYQWATTEFSG